MALAGLSIGTLIKGFFALVDLVKRVLVHLQLRKAKQEGRTEQRLESLEEREGKRRDAEADFRKVDGNNEDLRGDL